MKKLSKKLVLSSLSLGLAVATLSTTTYAWYTNNTSVSADSIQGTTDAAASAGLLISNEYNGTYSNSTSLATENYTVAGDHMIPLEYDATHGLKELDATGPVSTSDGKYLQFSLFVKATSDTNTTPAVPVYLKSLTIANAATTLTEFDVIKEVTGCFSANATKYSVDAAQALNVAIAGKKLGSVPADKDTTIGSTAYSVNNIVSAVEGTGLSNNPDALTYYNGVMGTSLTRPAGYVTELSNPAAAVTDPTKAIKVVDIADANIYEVVFTIWLDGWDAYCFDACKGQSFKVSVELTTELGDVSVVPAAA